MGRVSKKGINKALEKDLEDQLSFIVSSLINRGEIEVFLNEFLTREEKIMLGKRLVLYMLLLKGLTNTQINNVLSLSHETTRWYRELFDKKPELFKKTVDRLLKREQMQEFWKKVEKLLEPVGLMLQAKTNMRARARLLGGEDLWKE